MNRSDRGNEIGCRATLPFLVGVLLIAAPQSTASGQSPTREGWTTSRVKGTPDPPPPYTVEPIFEDVTLNQPTEMVRVAGTDRWIVCEVGGRIHSFSKSPDRQGQLAINMRDAVPQSNQVFGITFHPDYPTQPWCYIAFKARNNQLDGTRLSRFEVTNTALPIIDPTTETILARWNSEGHSGGSLHFGPDGYLYVSIGDGQNPNPPDKRDTGQDLSDLEASILRIDVDHPTGRLPYGIPSDNPFVGQSNVRGEIWAFGLRNPWKMAFDPVSETLWTGDVGWEMMEMVYRIDRGANYGWSVKEGSQIVKENGARADVPITPPIVEHSHLEARSITGGYFWYSDRLPELRASYLYGDWMTGKIWGVRHDGNEVTWQQELADTSLRVICFALDDDGEVLVVGYDGGVYRLVRNDQPAASESFPRRLSETGLFAATADQVPAAGVFEYEINAHHWADYTTSRQWIAVPGQASLGVYDVSDWKTGQVADNFRFPHDTVLAKTVTYRTDPADVNSTRKLETQLLHRHRDDWNAYNYVWNDDQTDAELQGNVASQRELKVKDAGQPNGFRTQTWHHASRDECLLCHIWSANTIHGFKPDQLARPDPLGGGNQIDRFVELGILDEELPEISPVVSPSDASASLEARARSYLDVNCAHCHRRGGGGTAPFVLNRHVPLDQLQIVDAPPSQGTFDLMDARVVAAGDPNRSVLMYRLVKSGRGHMPQFGPSLIDEDGVRLISHWIASMPADQKARHEISNLSEAVLSDTVPLSDKQSDHLHRLFESPTSTLALALACYGPTVDRQVRLAIADLASRHPQSSVRDLFEHFLPRERRTKRLGPTINSEALLAIEGDAESGKKLFFTASDVNCRQCHRIGDSGVAVGPDLSSIGIERTREEILESLVRPSAKIDAKYRGTLVLTSDGSVISGLVLSDTDHSMTIVEPSGKSRTLASDHIESVRTMEKSVMPEFLLSEFTAQQAADLLAFLVAQKQPVSVDTPGK